MPSSTARQLRRVRNGFRRAYELATSSRRTLPDYLVIGGQKCGTTSLHNYLKQHPDLAIHRCKEIHFFDTHYGRGESWYRTFFPTRQERITHHRRNGRVLVTGEATPYYLFHPEVPRRAARMVPDAKVIVMLRDPVDRAFSHYNHNLRRGREPLSFSDAIAAEPERTGCRDRIDADNRAGHSFFSYLGRGLYAEQLERWLAFYRRDRILVLQSEQFFADPAAGLERIARFLALRTFELTEPAGGFRRHNPGRYTSKLNPKIRAALDDFFRPHNTRLYELLGVNWRW